MSPLEKAIEHYLAGTASAEEIKLVNNWYHHFNDEEVEINTTNKRLYEQLEKRIAQRLQQTIRPEAKAIRSNSIIKKKWLAAAAVLVIAIGGASYYLSTRQPDTLLVAAENVKLHKPIKPGDNKATLTLADGSVITLDSLANGAISQQGNTKIIKLNNGQLAYKNGDITGNGKPTYNTIRTPRGGQYQVTLPDGTAVWINSASALTFPTTFAADGREVTLQGEAYFEVAHITLSNGKRKPFTVLANRGSSTGMKVNVLGTRFNIMNYEDEEMIKTTLTEGSVEASNNLEKVLIKPGQQAAIKNKETHIKVAEADLKEVLAWKNGEFRFTASNIKNIMRQMSRWYDVEVEYRGDVSNINLSGVVPKKDDIQQLLDVLSTTGKVRFEVSGNKIITIAN